MGHSVSDGNPNAGGDGANKAYRRMLFVGLGGSGGKTLRFLKRDIEAWLRGQGWNEGIPQGWQFLQIDTPTKADGAEIKSAPMLSNDEYLGLVGNGVDLDQLDKSMFPQQSKNRLVGSSWRVVPQSLNVNIQTGAGQYRAVGRSVALAYLGPIRERLRVTFGKLTQPASQASLSQLFMQVHKQPPTGNVESPLVVVVSSLAGGTGAGLINDVCDLLRDINPDAGESIGILYTPDVFNELLGTGGNDAAGIQPNSLAAICEVLNGYWWHGGAGGTDVKIPLKENALMTQANAINPLTRTGPAYPFLVGSKNSHGVSYQESSQLFEIVGAALTSWVTDLTVQSKLIAYSQSNWRNGAATLRVTPHALVNKGSAMFNEAGLNAFNALGFARVSLGTQYFENYASERIARDAVEFIAKNFENGSGANNLRASQPNITTQELIDRQAEEQVDSFMRLCGLSPMQSSEYHFAGTPYLPIEARIRPENLDSFYYECLDWAVTQSDREGNHLPQDWLSWITPSVEDAAAQFKQRCAPIVEENLVKLISELPREIVAQVLRLIGMVGLQIAERVLEKSIQRLIDPTHGYIANLKEIIQSDARFAPRSYWETQAQNVYSGKKKKIASGSLLKQSCEGALVPAVYGTGAEMKTVTVDFLDQLVTGFLRPMQQALATASNNYTAGIGTAEEWPNWPMANGIATLSQSSRPPMSEYTILKNSDFPQIFDGLLAETVPALPGQNASRQFVVRSAVIDGEFLDSVAPVSNDDAERLAKLAPLRIINEWWPNINQHLATPRMVSQVVFETGFDLDRIKSRAKEWLNRKDTPIKTLLDSSLRSYLDRQSAQNMNLLDAVMVGRQGDFLQAFTSAVDASRPLVELDTQLMSVLYPGQSHPKVSVEVSTMPFEGHELQDVLAQKISQLNGITPGAAVLSDYFSVSAGIKHIDITSRLSGPYPILAISSLLMPIAQAWKSLTADGRGDFWDKRRARPLNEFIPAPQEHILAMLRGWFLGRKLGLIGKVSGGTYFVAPRGQQPGYANRELPKVLLSTSEAAGDEPAIVLESLGLAYVEVGVANSLEPLAGYINMLELGRGGAAPDDGLLSDYDQIADYVQVWIETGELTLGSGFSNPVDKAWDSSMELDTPAGRRSALKSSLEAELKMYQDEYPKYVTRVMDNANYLTSTPYWPSMFWLIETSLSQLIKKL
jgi:hypothetical protein